MTTQPTEPVDVRPPDHPGSVARFGTFELDMRNAELRRDGVRIKLQDQPCRLLVLLVRNPGEVITREQIRQELWPETHVEFDQSLNAAIRKLRAALDDSAENPRFIETLAKRGYRFIAPVSWPADAAAAPVVAAPSKRRAWIGVAIAVLVVIAAVAGFRLWQRSRTPWLNVVAVLPFTADDKVHEQLADGLTEILIDDISNLPNLRVMARTTSFRYKGNADVMRAARELNVEGLVTGNIRHANEQYSIHVELIDGSDGTQIWGDEFRARDNDLPSLQGEIARALSLRLKRGLRGTSADTKNAIAYDLYMRGLYEWNKRDAVSLGRALDLFNRAIAADPSFARAYAGIAQVYGVMVGYGQITPDVGTPKILAAAGRALELDPSNAEALTSVATTKYRNLWDFAGAERDYRRAIASNPNYATAHQWYADFLRSVGRRDEGRRENEIAYKLDPFAPATATMMCYALYYDHEYDAAIAFYRKGSHRPDMKFVQNCAVRSLFAKGDADTAVREIENSELDPAIRKPLVDAYRKGGTRGFQQALLDWMLHEPNPETARPIEIADLYTGLGEKDKAFEWLEKAYQRRISRVTSITYEPGFEPLRSDPRYIDLVRRIGLPLPPAAR